MAFDCYVGNLTQPGSTGTQAITGVGFQPKAVLFFIQPNTTDGSSANLQVGFGAATSSTARGAISGWSQDNQGTSSTLRATITTGCLYLRDGGTNVAAADMDSLDSDGFTLDWTVTDATGRKVGFIALGGDDLTNASVLNFNLNNTTGNQSVTGAGFQPDCVIFLQALVSSASTFEASLLMGLGFAVSSTERSAFGISSENGQGTSDTDKRLVSDECISLPWNGGVLQEADFVSMDSDGFTINLSSTNGTRRCVALCLKGGQYAIGTDTQKTSTGTKATSGLGFQPTGLILGSANATSSASTTNTARMSVGFASGATERACVFVGDTDNQSTTVSDTDYDSAAAIKMLTEGTPTVDAEADLSSFDSDGFTLNWGTADATAREFAYLAFGSDAGGASVLALDEGMLVGGLQSLSGGLE